MQEVKQVPTSISDRVEYNPKKRSTDCFYISAEKWDPTFRKYFDYFKAHYTPGGEIVNNTHVNLSLCGDHLTFGAKDHETFEKMKIYWRAEERQVVHPAPKITPADERLGIDRKSKFPWWRLNNIGDSFLLRSDRPGAHSSLRVLVSNRNKTSPVKLRSLTVPAGLLVIVTEAEDGNYPLCVEDE